MPVTLFTDGLEPENPEAVIWRFLELWKFRSLIESGELYFRRADRFPQDETEGLPTEDYAIQALRLNPLDIEDCREIDAAVGSVANFRQSFFINCWYLDDDDSPKMWRKSGPDAVAIVSRYSLLKAALAELRDDANLGLIRYGTAHLTGWNLMRFITTKKREFADEKEVRALLWIRDDHDGMSRHYDINNIPHDRPVLEPPDPKEFVTRPVDLKRLITQVVLNPWASANLQAEVQGILRRCGYSMPVLPSQFTRFRDFLPV